MQINNWNLFISNKANISSYNDFNFASFQDLKSVTTPCLFEDIIAKNNILGDIYYSDNMYSYKKYEDYHQIYVTNFKSNKSVQYLKLKGIDTISDIFVNGEKVGSTDNQFLPFIFKLENLKDDNELIIHIYPNVIMGRNFDLKQIIFAQPSNYESIFLRKTASSFGWDILPRTCLGGIFRDVEVVDSIELIKNFNVTTTEIKENKAYLNIEISLERSFIGKCLIEGNCEDSKFSSKIHINGTEANTIICVDNPKLWNIRGFGEQNLYTVVLKLVNDDEEIESKQIRIGIRQVELFRTSVVQENGCFEFHINGKKVFLLGSNYVPIEALKHIDNERMKKCLDMVIDVGCNCLRVWGGGTYESDEFYSLCDELGIFVWQDFMMGCAVYPNVEPIMSGLDRELRYIVPHLKSHPSICLWAGDNECDICAAGWTGKFYNPNENKITRKLIPSILKELDNSRPYLPSSPYLDEYSCHHTDILSEDHLWGPRDYFKGNFYTTMSPYFTSETGYHGLNSPESLNKFIKKTWPLFENEKNPTREYLCHSTEPTGNQKGSYAYRTGLMFNQVKTLFKKVPEDLDTFALASQISQAEAFKFFIEKMRFSTKRNGGIIWWNILDGWPQVSDAVVDYYFSKKVAYNYIKNSQNICLLMMNEDKNKDIDFIVSNINGAAHNLYYEVIDGYDNNKVILSGNLNVDIGDFNKTICHILKDGKSHFYVIKYKDETGKEFINHFHTDIINIDLEKYYHVAKDNGILLLDGFDEGKFEWNL